MGSVDTTITPYFIRFIKSACCIIACMEPASNPAPPAPSKLVLDVTAYIRRHLSEPITTEQIAAALFLSRSRLSVKFKQETGQNLIDFILKEKTDEAKRLLRYTDKPAAAISAYLGFSSQSHFSRVFKKYAGCQPNEYRKRFGG